MPAESTGGPEAHRPLDTVMKFAQARLSPPLPGQIAKALVILEKALEAYKR